MELEALNDQVLGSMDYHKIHGFVYGTLINSTPFKEIHDNKSFKFFSYSNIFPPSQVKKGQIFCLHLRKIT